MTLLNANYLNIGRRLTITLALLITLFLFGNGLVILQFQRARRQTDRLTSVSQQLIAVLRLQEGLLSFHQRLNDLALSKDAQRLSTESQPLRAALLEQTRQARSNLAYLPPEFQVDPAFQTALDTFETTLPSQLGDITDLASAGDWQAAQLRIDNELSRMEAATSSLVKSIDRELDEELPRAVANMRDVQRRAILIVPATAISTVLTAAFFGWAIARRILELRLEERLNERTRIARELHDTLLQSFQAVLMKFSVVSYLIPDRPAEAQKTLENAVDLARVAITEGREAVQGLRSSNLVIDDLAQAIETLGEVLSSERAGQPSPHFHVKVEGAPRELSPKIRDDVYRIVGEALRNAFHHSQAERIEVEIHFEHRQLTLKIRDNGKGLDQQILERGGRPGHYGLASMRERADIVGGRLAIRSQPDSGTEVQLSVPASAAFTKSSEGRRSTATSEGTV